MNDEIKNKMALQVRDFRMPRYEALPDMGLYLEQVVKYINGYLSPIGFGELTPSMVSNYVKKGIIEKPVKKQYLAHQIAYLFFVAVVKNLVSIEDVGRLIKMQISTYTLPVAYNYFCMELENTLLYVFGLKDRMDELGETDSDEKALLSSLIFSASHVIYMKSYFRQLREDEKNP